MTGFQVIKIDCVELGKNGIGQSIFDQVIVSDSGQVIVFEVIDEHREAFAQVLSDDVTDDKI